MKVPFWLQLRGISVISNRKCNQNRTPCTELGLKWRFGIYSCKVSPDVACSTSKYYGSSSERLYPHGGWSHVIMSKNICKKNYNQCRTKIGHSLTDWISNVNMEIETNKNDIKEFYTIYSIFWKNYNDKRCVLLKRP